ncbi:MAG: DUF222 domain-containing protein, partial [Acidimicrobiia bacterium]
MFASISENPEEITPGAGLARVLELLDYEHVSPFDLVRVLKAQQRQVAHYQAASCWSMDRLVSVYQHSDRGDDPKDLEWGVEGAAAEIGAALSLTRASAVYETGLALDLCRRLPRVWLDLCLGKLDMRRARVLVDETLNVTETIARNVVDSVLVDAPGLTTGQLRHRLRKLCIDADPGAAVCDFGRSILNRRLVVEANPSGTANILGLDVAPHVAASISRWIHKQAIKLKDLGDIRTMDQLRADIATDLLRRRYRAGKVTRADFGNLDIKMTAETLTGVSDESAELGGYGPVIADVARQVADHQEHVERRWMLIDPDTKQAIDGGICRRKPTVSHRRRTELLHPTCIHPGCRMPSVDCDIDHRIPWSQRLI